MRSALLWLFRQAAKHPEVIEQIVQIVAAGVEANQKSRQ